MLVKKLSFLLLSSVVLFSCRKPEPISIKLPQQKDVPVLSATMADDKSVVVTAGYSIGALTKVDEDGNNDDIPRGLLVDSGMVRITNSDGQAYTLRQVSAGVFATNELQLTPGASYTLQVTDYKKGTNATATTVYMPQPQGSKVTPVYEGVRGGDTLYKLQVNIPDAQQGAQYFISYTTTRQLRETMKALSLPASKKMSAIATLEPKQLELLQSNTNGELNHAITIKVCTKDTLLVQVGRVDDGYYKYLQAYKRTGYLINQLTGEPINLPTNVKTGYGYFALCKPNRYVFDMNKYVK